MKNIIIGFSKNRKCAIGSKLIMAYMRTKFSHTYLRIKLDTFNEDSVFHAVGRGATIVSYSNFLIKNEPIKEFNLNISDELFDEICNEFHKRSGKDGYGFLQNIGILIAEKLKLTKNPFDDGLNCSEWIAYCLEEIYPERWKSNERDFNLVKPSEVYEFLTLPEIPCH